MLATVFALLMLAPSTASAGQARLFAGTFGAASNPAPFPSNPYPLSGAEGVAVDDATGDVYVNAPGTSRVEKFDSSGHFLLMFGAGVLATGVEGSGDLTAGSSQVTNISTTKHSFLAGEEISGPGIAPQTTILTVGAGALTLTLSKPATATETGAALQVVEGAGNVPVNELQQIVLGGSPSGGSFSLSLETSRLEGTIAEGSNQVTDVTTEKGELKIGDNTGVASAEGSGAFTAGSTHITGFTTQRGTFAVGEPVGGPGIPAGTTVAAVGAGELTLSAAGTHTTDEASVFAIATVAAIDPAVSSFTLSAESIDSQADRQIIAEETTAPIPYNATASEVANALEGVPYIGSGNVALSGSAGGPWTVEFKGPRLSDSPVPKLAKNESDSYSLQPQATSSVRAIVVRPGHDAPGVCATHCASPFEEGKQSEAGLATPFEQPSFIAVDNAAGPSQGDVYIANGPSPRASGASFGMVDKLTPTGQSVEGWGDPPTPDGILTGKDATSPPGPFGTIHGIAVDPSGNLWVNAESSASGEGVDATFEFDSSAKPTGGFIPIASGFFGVPVGPFAVDSEDNIYSTIGAQPALAEKFTATGKLIGVVGASGAELEEHETHPELGRVFEPTTALGATAFAVDPTTGDLYLAGTEGTDGHSVIRRYDSSCHPVTIGESPERQPGCVPAEAFGAGLIKGNVFDLAIDSSTKSLYVAEPGGVVADFAFLTVPDVVTGKPANPTHTSATLTGTVNPSGIEPNPGSEGCRFEWGEVGKPYEHSEECRTERGEPIGNGSAPVPVHADISGLHAGGAYHYRLVASNHNDENASVHQPSAGADLVFGPPLIESSAPLSVSSDTAELQSEVNPRDVQTRVCLQYVTQQRFEESGFAESQSIPCQDVGSSGSGETPTVRLTGLVPRIAYRYRVVAESVLAEGAEAVTREFAFETQSTGVFSLPDSRGWEMVSPPKKLGASIQPIRESGVVEAAASGDAITYLAASPTDAEPEGFASFQQQLSVRGPAGWSTSDVGVPHLGPAGAVVGQGYEYKFFNSALTLGVFQPMGEFDPAISPEASEQTAFVHDLGSTCTGACYHPFVTAREGFANVPEGTQIDKGESCTSADGKPATGICGPQFVGGTEDLSHAVLTSANALSEGAVPGELYEWSPGAPLAPISVLPDGEQTGASLGYNSQQVSGAISADGSRIVWAAASEGGSLYLRDVNSKETIQLDAAEPACLAARKCQSGGGRFSTASAEGSRVFFTDERALTANSGAGQGKQDLYECQVALSGEEKLSCELTDLTPKGQGSESAEVQGVLGASSDGSYLYFVANGVLAHNVVDNGAGEERAQAGQPNVYRFHEGATAYITTLSGEDSKDWGGVGAEFVPAGVSPNGQWFELMSARSLTGYDNRDLATGRPAAEVYLYGAATGRLICASCDPTGARPHGVEYYKLEPAENGLVGGPTVIWPHNALVAANVPGALSTGNGFGSRYRSRYLTDEGRLFFDTVNALVPQDANGTQDVYEYEPPGVGSCTESSVTFGEASGGCVGLISSGTSREESAFLDASESGDDVFFLTYSRLVPKDEDAAADVYDARVDGGEGEPPRPVECQGDACQGFVQAPNDPTPGSLTFSGPGNLLVPAIVPSKTIEKTAAQLKAEKLSKALRVCQRTRARKKRRACAGTARKRYGASKTRKAGKASYNRRTGR
jgi:hypothetical protein